MGPLYLDTSAVLRPILESGTTPQIEARLRDATVLLTSRLALVESSRVFHRLRLEGRLSETQLVDAERAVDEVWNRCELWELTPTVCEMARQVAPGMPIRTLDALHLAAATRVGANALTVLTYDVRQAQVARALGMTVVGC
jgi:hypothetical protein